VSRVQSRSPSGRRKRVDAVRNRDAVIAAAADAFAEKGLDAGIPDIAQRAGVGKGTVYRSFPTKDHLIAAVVIERLTGFRRRLEEAAGEEDAWEALRAAVLDTSERKGPDRSLHEGLSRTLDLPEVQAARAENLAALGLLVRRAQEQGAVRRDVVAEDLPVLFSGVSSVLADDPEATAATWRRYLTLVLDSLRAGGAEPLPGRPARRRATRRRPRR
jgi:AcrR family transcriptional regulator